MSLRRSRSGGMTMRTTFRRYHRSSRNLSSSTMRCRSRLVAAITRTSTFFGARRAHRADFVALQEAQQRQLEIRLDVADFVQENRAAVGRFEHAHAVAVGAGEGAAHGAEQLAFEQRGRDRAAIHRHERLAGRARLKR